MSVSILKVLILLTINTYIFKCVYAQRKNLQHVSWMLFFNLFLLCCDFLIGPLQLQFAVSPGQAISISDDMEVVALVGSNHDLAKQINQKEIRWGVSFIFVFYVFSYLHMILKLDVFPFSNSILLTGTCNYVFRAQFVTSWSLDSRWHK